MKSFLICVICDQNRTGLSRDRPEQKSEKSKIKTEREISCVLYFKIPENYQQHDEENDGVKKVLAIIFFVFGNLGNLFNFTYVFKFHSSTLSD